MHDARGKLLKVGDRILVPAVITQLSPQEEYCNVSIETCIGRRPDNNKERISAINTGVLLRCNEGDGCQEFAEDLAASFEGIFVRTDEDRGTTVS